MSEEDFAYEMHSEAYCSLKFPAWMGKRECRSDCGCPTCYDYRNLLVARDETGKWCSQLELDSASALAAIGTIQNPYWGGYKYQEGDLMLDTQPGFAPSPDVASAAPYSSKCECGSGSDELSGAHSHWCPRHLP